MKSFTGHLEEAPRSDDSKVREANIRDAVTKLETTIDVLGFRSQGLAPGKLAQQLKSSSAIISKELAKLRKLV